MEFTGNLEKDIEIFTELIGAEKGMFFSLLDEMNDWSFIIKLNAFIEAAVTELVVKVIQKDKIRPIIARLDIADSRFGKVEWLKSLNILTSEDRSRIRTLAELRNFFVHNISHINYTLENYVASLDPNQLKSFINNFGYDVHETMEIGGKKILRAKFIKENPKLSIWVAVFYMLGSIILEFNRLGLQAKELELIKKKAIVVDALLRKMRIAKHEARMRALLKPITEKGNDG